MKLQKAINWFVIGTFVVLYLVVSTISTIHSVAFFKLSNPDWLAIFLAVAFEIGAAASLASIVVLKRINMYIVWSLFILLTAMQAMSNTYHSFVHLNNYQGWIELFGLQEEDPIFQKRILALISGAILPLIALGFIKSLVDYLKNEPEREPVLTKIEEPNVIIEPTIDSPSSTIEKEHEIIQEQSIEEVPILTETPIDNPDFNISTGNEKNINR